VHIKLALKMKVYNRRQIPMNQIVLIESWKRDELAEIRPLMIF
jgi:hypothetical protein